MVHLGESVSGFHACHEANQIGDKDFEDLDQLAFKLENGLLRLVEALEEKDSTGSWTDTLVIRESNAIYQVGSLNRS
jgi:hypothetical protein